MTVLASKFFILASPFIAIDNLLQKVWTIVTALAIPFTTLAFLYYALMLVMAASNEQKATSARKGLKRVLVAWGIIGGYFLFKALATVMTKGFGVS
jgi:hypothetical protein